MAIAITNLNNEAGVAKAWTKLGSNLDTSTWFNTDDSTGGIEVTLSIRNRTLGMAPNGSPIRQCTVVVIHSVPSTVVVANGNSKNYNETYKNTWSLVGPVSPNTITTTQRNNIVAYQRNFCTAANVGYLMQGQV